jgi:hypothetical protein
MEDSRILDLYWERSETAIYETQLKYGHYCFSIADNILPFREDAEGSVNDTYLAAWNTIPLMGWLDTDMIALTAWGDDGSYYVYVYQFREQPTL